MLISDGVRGLHVLLHVDKVDNLERVLADRWQQVYSVTPVQVLRMKHEYAFQQHVKVSDRDTFKDAL